jgi:polyisoprenoid-binding protein YceI
MKRLSLAVIATTALSMGLSLPAMADWTLSTTESTLQFVSIKKNSIGEVHSFGELQGKLTEAGALSVVIGLSSVKTGIDIRDTRLKENLFEVVKFPEATVTAQIDAKAIKDLKLGQQLTWALPINIDLHGKKADYVANVVVTHRADGKITAFTKSPILLKASDFGLEAGIETLKQLAVLDAIASNVPVSVQLVLEPAKAAMAKK